MDKWVVLSAPSLQLYVIPTYIHFTEGGWGVPTLDEVAITTDSDTWYEYYAKCDGMDVEVESEMGSSFSESIFSIICQFDKPAKAR